ncbi:hypothetical protein FB567DRAFT_553707 [Paraphoma chrysanthemicola]|uniref:Rhodopsin domain-containing protein n=1 Tax=Paraphoma chrysanthemicola TaxID=798071 RepID=A0A8K0VU87_9PLEO|nr:hypothetical protein FB567DRAFT_553707 [Paraphoma chrysanthemicola]
MQSSSLSYEQSSAVQQRDKSDDVKTATWILLGVTVLVVVARQITKVIVVQKLCLDDLFMAAASASAIAIYIIVIVLANKGLGVFGLLTVKRADILMKGYYASDFLYVTSICFSKLSLLALLYNVVAAQRLYRRMILGFGAFVFLWGLTSVLVVAFQCELPRPWEMMTLRCFNTPIFWAVYCAIDVSTDICFIVFAVSLVAHLRLRVARKAALIACFLPRACVVAASLARLIWLYPVTAHTTPQYRLWLPVILTQVHVCLSVCTACIPNMVPIFRSLEGGLRRTRSSSKGPGWGLSGSERRSSSLWFRRQSRQRTVCLQHSGSLRYERVAQASPQLPNPRVLIPLTPPPYHSRPATANAQFSGARGLNISIPDRSSPLPQVADIASPQTASSFALSPSCTSPAPLLPLLPRRRSGKLPTPPPKTHSPRPPTTSSCYSSNNVSPTSPPPTARLHLFPPSASAERKHSPKAQQQGFQTARTPPIYPSTSERGIHPHGQRMQSLRLAPLPKFSTAPHPLVPPSTTIPNSRERHVSVQELTSPMGAAINHYFNTAEPEMSPPPPELEVAPLSGKQQRNRQVLSPSNTLRAPIPPPTSPLPALPHEVLRHNLGLPRDSIGGVGRPRSHTLPRIQDARSSPRLIVRELN